MMNTVDEDVSSQLNAGEVKVPPDKPESDLLQVPRQEVEISKCSSENTHQVKQLMDQTDSVSDLGLPATQQMLSGQSDSLPASTGCLDDPVFLTVENCKPAMLFTATIESDFFNSGFVSSSNRALPEMDRRVLTLAATTDVVEGVFFSIAIMKGSTMYVRYFESGCLSGAMSSMAEVLQKSEPTVTQLFRYRIFTQEDLNMKIQHLKHAANNRSRSHTEDGDTGLKRQRYSQYFRTKYNGCKDVFDRLSLLALSEDFRSSFQVSSVIFHCIRKFADENRTDSPLHIFGLGATAPYSQVLKTHKFKQHTVAESVDFKNLKEEIKPKTIEEQFDILSSMSNYHWKIDRSVQMLQYFSTGDIKTRKSPTSIRNKIIYALRAGCQDKYRSSVKMLSDQYISILPWAPRLVNKRHNDELFGRVKRFANSFILPKPTVSIVTQTESLLENSLTGLQTVEDGITLHQGPQKQSLLANPVRRETCSVILPKTNVTSVTKPTSLLTNSSIGQSQDGSTLHQGPKKRCLLANPVRRKTQVTFNNSVILPKPTVTTSAAQPTSLLTNSSTGLSQDGCTLHQGPKKQSLLSYALRRETFDNSVILPKPTDTTRVTQTASFLTNSSIGQSQDGSTLHQGPKKRCLLANPVRRETPVTFDSSVILPKPTDTTRVTQTSLLTNSSIGRSQGGSTLHQGREKRKCQPTKPVRQDPPVTVSNSVILPKPTLTTSVAQPIHSSTGLSQNGSTLHQGPIQKKCLPTRPVMGDTSVTFNNSILLPLSTVTTSVALCPDNSFGKEVSHDCYIQRGMFKSLSFCKVTLLHEEDDDNTHLQYSWI